MKYKEIHIGEEINYFDEIKEIYPIPTNTFIDKFLPGLGVTYGELVVPRHKICTLPHLPPIIGKGKKHKDCFTVYGRKTIEDVTGYLNNEKFPIKKIICTPEAYANKVKPAIELNENFNLYKDFFFLFDECDKLISDIDYRAAISLPMKDFFQFDNKAMVSATPLMPSDPRFDEHNFTYVKIIPDYDCKNDLSLIITNNVNESLRKYLKELNEPCFIFYNSVDGIMSVINGLGLSKNSSVFCGEKSISKVKYDYNFHAVFTELDKPKDLEQLISENNFFTSRFYTAVDFDLPKDSNVIMITNLFQAEHSILDPNTDSKQIPGRFRFDKIANQSLEIKRLGAKSITHITNYNPEIEYEEEVEVREFLKGAVMHIVDLYLMKSKCESLGEFAAIEKSLEGNQYSNFIHDNGVINHFMIDNYINYERLKKMYSSPENIIDSYKSTKFFNLNVREVEIYPVSDSDKRFRSKKNTPVVLKSLAKQLDNLITNRAKFDFNFIENQKELTEIKKLNPKLYDAFIELGYDGLEKEGFIMKNIEIELEAKKWKSAKKGFYKLTSDVHKIFLENKYSDQQIREILNEIYSKNQISKTPKVSDINKFYKTRRTSDSNNDKVTILERKSAKLNEKFISRIFKVAVPKGVS